MFVKTQLPIGELNVDLESRQVVTMVCDGFMKTNLIVFVGSLLYSDPNGIPCRKTGFISSPSIPESIVDKMTTLNSGFFFPDHFKFYPVAGGLRLK